MKSKLGIDFDKVGHAREMARKIADQVQDFVDGYTTVAVERTLCRLLGIDGVDVHAVPLPNILVDELKEKNVLGEGILFFLGNVMVETGMTPQEIAEQVAAGKVDVPGTGMYSRPAGKSVATLYRGQYPSDFRQPETA